MARKADGGEEPDGGHSPAEPGEDRPPPRPGFVERVGAALVRPSLAVGAAADAGSAGRSATDVVVAIALLACITRAAVVVSSVWTMASGDVGAGLTRLATGLFDPVAEALGVVVVATVVVFIASGRGRALGRDSDMACVAFVPVAMVSVIAFLAVASLSPGPAAARVIGIASRCVAFTWAGAVCLIAVAHNRGRARSSQRRAGIRPAGWVWIAVMVAGLAVAGTGVARHLDRVRPVVTGDAAPSFELPSIDARGQLGAPVSLADLRGKVVVLDFWATWCGPCIHSMPVLQRINLDYASRGVVVVSINTEGPDMAASARNMANRLGMTTVQLSDDGQVSSRYRATTIPHMVVIDRAGRVVEVHTGFSTAGRLRSQLSAAIEEALATPAPR